MGENICRLNITKRILGEDIPISDITTDTNIFSKLKKMFGIAK